MQLIKEAKPGKSNLNKKSGTHVEVTFASLFQVNTSQKNHQKNLETCLLIAEKSIDIIYLQKYKTWNVKTHFKHYKWENAAWFAIHQWDDRYLIYKKLMWWNSVHININQQARKVGKRENPLFEIRWEQLLPMKGHL